VPREDGTQDKSHELTREEAVDFMKKRMEEDAASPQRVRSRRLRLSAFWIAFIATPFLLVGLTIAAFATVGGSVFDTPVFLSPFALLAAAVVAAVVFGITGKGAIASGILAGVALVVVGSGITCFIALVSSS